MINKIGLTARNDIRKIVRSWVEEGMFATRIYAAACLGTVRNINICETNVMIIEDIFRYSRQLGIIDVDVLTRNVASYIIMRMEEMARYDD